MHRPNKETTMTRSRKLQILVTTAVCTAAAAQPALAGGELKNTTPFIRAATPGRLPAAAIVPASAIVAARAAIAGESKNLRPFIRRLSETDALDRFLSHAH